MYCKNCGTYLDESHIFCGNCGTEIEKIKPKAKFAFIKNKKFLSVVILLISVLAIVFCAARFVKIYNPKYNPKPECMTADAKNPGDYGVAIRYTRELAKKHNTKFHIMGYAYFYYNTTNTYDLMTIYVYSDEYPQVYVSYCVNPKYGSTEEDTYLMQVQSWEQKNLIYDIAEDLDINTNKIAVYVGITYTENIIYGDLLVNDSIDLKTIEKLVEEVKDETNSDSVTFKVYFVEKGNNKKFKDYMEGSGVSDELKPETSFGNWKKYNIVMDDDGIKTEFKWEHK